MTIICALHQHGETWIGADSRTSFGHQVYDHTQKWLVATDGALAVGLCGSGRARYLLEQVGEELFFQADAHSVAKRLHQAIIDDGWPLKKEDGGPNWITGGAIYADTTGVWQICCDFGVNAMPSGVFLADGSGEQFARGAAHTVARHEAGPEQVVGVALEAACRFDSGCGGRLMIRRLGDG